MEMSSGIIRFSINDIKLDGLWVIYAWGSLVVGTISTCSERRFNSNERFFRPKGVEVQEELTEVEANDRAK